MGNHTVELEIGSQTYTELMSLAKASGQPLDELLLDAARRVLEDASDMAAVARYEEQKANGTLETVPWTQLKAELGLDD